MKSKRYAEAAMFAKSYYPKMVPEIIKEWGDVLKQNDLLFIPENIFESKEFKKPMLAAVKTFEQQIDPLIYKQQKAPADEIEMQREKWYEDFIEGGSGGQI